MYNRAVMVGRLTADPELKSTPNGVSVSSFSIAVDRDFKSKDGEKQTDFLDVVCWRQSAEFISKYGFKGAMVLVEGSVQTRSCTDKNGQNRRVWEIQADKVKLLSRKENGTQGQPAASQATTGAIAQTGADDFTEVGDDGDLPF